MVRKLDKPPLRANYGVRRDAEACGVPTGVAPNPNEPHARARLPATVRDRTRRGNAACRRLTVAAGICVDRSPGFRPWPDPPHLPQSPCDHASVVALGAADAWRPQTRKSERSEDSHLRARRAQARFMASRAGGVRAPRAQSAQG